MWDFEEFCGFLLSECNSLFQPEELVVHQDMTRPLAHYWIHSSHNTYLTDAQVTKYHSVSNKHCDRLEPM